MVMHDHREVVMERWVAITVSMTEHPVLSGGEFCRRSAFLWLIANAAWKDHQVRAKGGIITLRRGEVITGRAHLADVWQWSEKRVRTFMGELAKCGMIEEGQRIAQYANIATICNYDRYQGVGPAPIQELPSEIDAEVEKVVDERMRLIARKAGGIIASTRRWRE
jgi:hypothetical protein